MFWAMILVISMSLLNKVQGEESQQFLIVRTPGYAVFVPPDRNAKQRKYFVSNDFKCALRCTKEEWCNSANFELVSENDASGVHLCELLSTDEAENVKYLEKNGKFVYLSIKMLTHPCQKQPCLNEGTCIKVGNRGGLKCNCTKGFWRNFCQEGGVQTAIACEAGSMHMSCQIGKLLRIKWALYGRSSTDVCNKHSNLKVPCGNQALSLTKVKALCEGKQSCSFTSGIDIFGHDPCRGFHKYTEVKYECQGL